MSSLKIPEIHGYKNDPLKRQSLAFSSFPIFVFAPPLVLILLWCIIVIMYHLYVYRTIVLGLCTLLNIPILGLLAHWTQGSNVDGVTYSFEAMGLFTSAISFIILPAMIIVPLIRKNALFLYIVTELSIIGLLWIFWVVTAALVIQKKEEFYPLDNCLFLPDVTVHWCNELFGIEGLTVTVFVLLLKYTLVLLIYAIVATSKTGSQVWFQSVQEQKTTVNMPPMTHNSNSADLEGKGGSSPEISMATYPASTQAMPQTPYSGVQQPIQTGHAAPASNLGTPIGGMQQTNMQITRPMQQTVQSQPVGQTMYAQPATSSAHEGIVTPSLPQV